MKEIDKRQTVKNVKEVLKMFPQCAVLSGALKGYRQQGHMTLDEESYKIVLEDYELGARERFRDRYDVVVAIVKSLNAISSPKARLVMIEKYYPTKIYQSDGERMEKLGMKKTTFQKYKQVGSLDFARTFELADLMAYRKG